MIDPGMIVGVLAGAGLFLLGLATARVRRRRHLAAARSATGGCCLLGLAALFTAAALNFYTYQRLTYEQPVATVSFQQLGPARYRARLQPAGNRPARVYDLRGDEWQLDARVLKWRGVGNLLGLNARYRLERLSGRYADAAAQNSHKASAHTLATKRGLDLWRLGRRLQGHLPLLDAEYGSATYLPMTNGARYRVSLTQSGLIARPDNVAARDAVANW